jgi:diguanylate cyclase (GGDEF)-like protein
MEVYEELSATFPRTVSTETQRLANLWKKYADLTDSLARALALENRRLHHALDHECVRDRLTGLFTRRYLEESLDRELFRAQSRQYGLAVVVFHLDSFKAFQAECGPGGANILLQAVAHAMKSQVRPGDIACRYGAEEFAMVLFDAPFFAARNRAEQLRKAITTSEWCNNSRLSVHVTLSAGVASFPEHATTSLLLLQAADLALRRVIESGNDRVAIATSTIAGSLKH